MFYILHYSKKKLHNYCYEWHPKQIPCYQNLKNKYKRIKHTLLFAVISVIGSNTFACSPNVTRPAKSPLSKDDTIFLAKPLILYNLLYRLLLPVFIPILPLVSTSNKIRVFIGFIASVCFVVISATILP